MTDTKPIGAITHYFGNIQVGIIRLDNGSLKLGDRIKIKGHDYEFEQEIESMQIDHQDIAEAKKGEEFGTKVSQKVHEGDKVYLV